jgi:hypothetical protein
MGAVTMSVIAAAAAAERTKEKRNRRRNLIELSLTEQNIVVH